MAHQCALHVFRNNLAPFHVMRIRFTIVQFLKDCYTMIQIQILPIIEMTLGMQIIIREIAVFGI